MTTFPNFPWEVDWPHHQVPANGDVSRSEMYRFNFQLSDCPLSGKEGAHLFLLAGLTGDILPELE